MTAIRPAVLKQESIRLLDYYDKPEDFLREIHRLLDRYADRTHRIGQTGERKSILPSYNVPQPVLRQIYRDLSNIAQNNPTDTLNLCDKLWLQAHFELRSLAAFILGQIPLDPPEPVTSRIIEWANDIFDERMINALLDYGMARMRVEAQEEIFSLADTWLQSSNQQKIQLGIRVLIPIVDHPTAEAMPMIFRLTTPLIRQAANEVRPDVLVLWKRLAQSIPQETAYHLQQNLKAPENPDTKWFIRHLIHSFPDEQQVSLRNALVTTTST